LQLEDKPVGVVNSIVGQKRLQVQLRGEQGHAGALAFQKFPCFCSRSIQGTGFVNVCDANMAINWFPASFDLIERSDQL
jgi:hypothetical protein